jgi:acetyltransferase-like isoleucine patch superfamily enzyme
MAFGLIVYDLLYMILSFGLYGGALVLGGRIGLELAPRVPWPLALMAGAVVAIFSLIFEVALLSFCLPRLKPGRYTLMKGTVFYAWILRSLLRRILFLPGLKFVIFSSNILRFCALRGLGARISFTTNVSNDADLLDPALIELGPGATVGARCLLSGHYIENGKLVLGRVKVGEKSLLAVDVLLGPEVTIGARVMVKGRAAISVGVTVGDDAVIGGDVGLDVRCVVGAAAQIGNRAYVAPRAEVAPGARLAALAKVESTTSSAAPAV